MMDTSGLLRTGSDATMERISYYSFVRRLLSLINLLVLLTLAGCYGGSHPPRIGTGGPDFTLQDAERTITLSQFHGKVVILNFWATWCPPCVEETPSLVKLSRQLKDRGLVVLGVSVDVDGDAYHQFIKDHGIDYVTVRDAGRKGSNLYGTFKFPESYILDRQGVVRRKFIGAVNWNSPEVVEFLTKLTAT